MSKARWTWLDRIALAGMGASLAIVLQPWWSGGLRIGFFLTAVFTVLQIVTSHVIAPGDA